jgi:phosphoribosylformylglycinamidine synthase
LIKAESDETILTSSLRIGSPLKIPIAHGEGRFFADKETLMKMDMNDQVLFRYCDENGYVTEEANPNGALQNIAGICNEGKNVFGMMPHPERAADALSGNTDGLGIFKSILNFVTA